MLEGENILKDLWACHPLKSAQVFSPPWLCQWSLGSSGHAGLEVPGQQGQGTQRCHRGQAAGPEPPAVPRGFPCVELGCQSMLPSPSLALQRE